MLPQVIAYDPYPTVLAFHESDAKRRFIRGPFGSGKTSGCIWECVMMCADQEPDAKGVRRTKGLIIRNTRPQLISTTIESWNDWLGDFCRFVYSSPITCHFKMPWSDGTILESKIYFMSADNQKDLRKLKSLEISWCWANEASELQKDIVDGAWDRTGRYPPKRNGGCTRRAQIADTNSMDNLHWWYQYAEVEGPEGMEFFDQPGGLIQIQNEDGTFRYEPNPEAENIDNLPDGHQYYFDMLPGRSMEYIKVFVLNQYGDLKPGTLIYHNYSTKNHTDQEFDSRRKHVLWSHDQNMAPMSSVIVQQFGSLDVAVDEIIIKGADADMVADEFLDRYKGKVEKVSLFGDSFGHNGHNHGLGTYYKTIKKRLTLEGITVIDKTLKKNPSIKWGQQTVRQRIKDCFGMIHFKVNPNKCPYLDTQLQSGKLKEGSTQHEEETDFQHIGTAVRYMHHKLYADNTARGIVRTR